MAMTRKTRRLYFIGLGLFGLFVGVALVLSALQDNMQFFITPTELAAKPPSTSQHLTIGGLVEQGSLHKSGDHVSFAVTDMEHSLTVSYTGALPDLFREGQGVVADGKMGKDGIFVASDIMAKHDEKYMPREVVDALKKSGHWQEGGAPQGAAR